jgi:hypothetical protein
VVAPGVGAGYLDLHDARHDDPAPDATARRDRRFEFQRAREVGSWSGGVAGH